MRRIFRSLLVFVLITSWVFNYPPINFGGQGWLQIFNFPLKVEEVQAAVTYSTDCDGTIQTGASAVAISACDVGTGLTDAILIISVFGDDGGGTHGTPTVTRGTGSVCGTGTETATIIDTEVTSGDASVSTFRLLDANFAEGSADVCVSWASSDPPDEWSAHITVFTDVDQTTFTSATASATFGNVDVITSTITIVANEYGYQANTCNSNASVTTLNADDVERFVLTTAGGDKSTSHVSTQTTTGSPATMGVDLYSKPCSAAAMKLITLKDVAAAVTTIGDGTDPSNSTVAPESGIIDLDAVTFITDSGTDSITALTVTLGSGDSDNLSEVRITSNDGLTLYFSAISTPGSDTLNFSGGTAIPVTDSSVQFKVRITPETHANMPAPNGANYAITGTVSSFTSTNSQAGTDTDSATITIDNLSPNDVTSTSGSVTSDTSITINWTTSNSTDYNRSVVLRWQAATPGSDVPAENTNYALDATIGSATVACVENTGTDSTAYSGVDGSGSDECSTTALTAGTQYSYKHFEKDDNGNWNTGVTNANSPLTTTGGVTETLTFSISDNTIGFGTLDSGNARYATGDTAGSGTDPAGGAHTLTASTNGTSGYAVTVNGSILTSGADTITAMATEAVSSAGTEQFGIRITASGGNGVVDAVYDNTPTDSFALVTADFPDQIASDPDGDDVSTTYTVHYLANITAQTEAGSYTATLTYIATATF